MKVFKLITAALVIVVAMLAGSCKKDKKTAEVTVDPPGAPPLTWQEHWGYHQLLVSRVFNDENVVAYYDDSMPRTLTWPYKTLSDSWAYLKKTYGTIGPDPHIYLIAHGIIDSESKLGGGHPAGYFDPSHDYRNVLDCGLGPDDWKYPTAQAIGIPIHEIGHIITGNTHGVNGSPSDAIWGDSKFMEIFIYDVYLNIGRKDEADRLYHQMLTQDPYTPFPGMIYPGVRWFQDWFYPLYSQYGKGALLNRYFGVLADNYPQINHVFTRNRDMNLGEFVHFWSGATGVNLQDQAALTFDAFWDESAVAQFKQAQVDFPNVKYPR